MTRRLLRVAYHLYPEWWRDRYGEEAREVAEQLAGEGRSPARIAADVARDALRCPRRAPESQRPPAGSVVLRASGRSLSSGLATYLLMLAALAAAAAAADPDYDQLFVRSNGSGAAGLGFALVGRVTLLMGAGLLLLAAVASFSVMLARVVRARDRRGMGLAGAVVAPVAMVPVIGWGAAQIGHEWVTSGVGSVPKSPYLFAMILTDQHYMSRSPAASPVGLAVLCIASWVAIALVAALATRAARSLRGRAGLPVAYLRIDALLVFGGGVAMVASFACLLGWGLSAPVLGTTWFHCACLGARAAVGGDGLGGLGISGSPVVWWIIVAATGLACARSLVAGGRAVRQVRRLATF